MADVLLVIDQGTTSSRVIGFDLSGTPIAHAQKEHKQIYPQSGWVEHNPEEIWTNTLWALKKVYKQAMKAGHTPLGIGITNQRETTLAWDKKTDQLLYNAIVWQDKRTTDFCTTLNQTHGAEIKARTGLPTDPYFSGSKMHWLLENVPAVQKAAEDKSLAFGTIDSFLLWRLTGGKNHLTDTTNASRTLLFDIHTLKWAPDLCALFGIPLNALPALKPNTADFGQTAAAILPITLPICAMAGDQHAAMVGQVCFKTGMVKSNYGTGCFAMLNTGEKPVSSTHGLLTTIGYHVGSKPTYALEGSVFVAGAGVQWQRDKLGLITDAAETEALAQKAEGLHPGLYMVPAFAGLGAPWWNTSARGALVGMTLNTDKAALTHAMLEAVCFQCHDLFGAMQADTGTSIKEVRVDGGMITNNWLAQRLSCLMDKTIRRPTLTEITALGAAYLAGLQLGVYENLHALEKLWQPEATFTPQMHPHLRQEKHSGWQKAIAAVQHYATPLEENI